MGEVREVSERREEEIMSAAPGSRFLSLPPLSTLVLRSSVREWNGREPKGPGENTKGPRDEG